MAIPRSWFAWRRSTFPGHRSAQPIRGPFALTYLALLILGSVIATLLYWGIAVAQGLDPLPGEFNQAQGSARLDALRTALTVVGGAAAVAGLYVAYRRQRNDERNAAREQDKVFTERFVHLPQLLDGGSAGTRLLGLSALARLGDDSERDQPTCLEQLCAYLRRPVQLLEDAPTERTNFDLLVSERRFWADWSEWDVRRTAASILARRLAPDARPRWLGPIDLRDAVLIDADFSDSVFRSPADFRSVIMVGQALLARARFESAVDWRGATFHAPLDVSTVHFRDGQVFDAVRFYQHVNIEWNPVARISLAGSLFLSGLTIEAGYRSPASSWASRLFGSGIGMDPAETVDTEYALALRRAVELGDERFSLARRLLTFGAEIVSTTRKIDLRGAELRGSVTLPAQAIDVRGANLAAADELELTNVADHYACLDVRGLVEDDETRWPSDYMRPPFE